PRSCAPSRRIRSISAAAMGPLRLPADAERAPRTDAEGPRKRGDSVPVPSGLADARREGARRWNRTTGREDHTTLALSRQRVARILRRERACRFGHVQARGMLHYGAVPPGHVLDHREYAARGWRRERRSMRVM